MKVKEIPISFFYSIYLRYLLKTKTNKKQIPVVVSLTSIPTRLASLDIVIKSLLNQSIKPKQIILWLNYSLSKKIPNKLSKLQNDLFIIKFCEGTSSFRKLLPSLSEYPSSTIVTCDDDVIYPTNWLDSLYRAHLKEPEMVISQVGRLITRDKNKNLEEYKKWLFISTEQSAKNMLPIGYGGVLYPSGVFNKNVFDSDIFMKLCPHADDLWFKAMAYLNGRSAYCASEKARPIPIFRSQRKSLANTNIHKNGNYDQWMALCEHFPELKKIY